TILVNVPDSAKVAKEETFGPLAPLFRFKDEADVSPRSCSRRWKNCALATACRTASPPAR
ncbi:hypothetical protein CKQ90_14750, partial [Klebsiella pneumoniae]